MSEPDVALVSPYPPPGRRHAGRTGVASYTANLAGSLAGAGAGVQVLAPREDGEPPAHRDGDVAVRRPAGRGPGALLRLCRAAARTGAPVVHLQHELFLYGGPLSAAELPLALGRLRAARRTVVVTLHQVVAPHLVDRRFTTLHELPLPPALARAGAAGLPRLVGALAGRTIVHEEAFADHVPGATVIPHGLEEAMPPDRDRARRRLAVGEGFLALCFGFVAPYKGLETAAAAARRAPGVRLVVAGGDHPRFTGPEGYPQRLRRRAAGAARFTGFVPEPEVPLWFAAADVALFLYPRPHASSGALALALAHGTPVLLSPELAAATGAPGELTVPADAGAVAARLSRLAREPAARAALARATRGMAAGRSWPEVARRHLHVYGSTA